MDAASPTAVISHWSKLVENLHVSPLEFYAVIENAIKKREIPDTKTSRVDWHESGVFSAKREYLRIERGAYFFDVCGAPFGTGFFVSSWFTKAQSDSGPLALLLMIILMFIAFASSLRAFGFFMGLVFMFLGLPILFWFFVQFMNKQQEGWDDALVAMPYFGPIYERIFRPETYYKIDTRLMFQQAVHNAVMEAVDQVTSAKGIRALTELERKPILMRFAKSAAV